MEPSSTTTKLEGKEGHVEYRAAGKLSGNKGKLPASRSGSPCIGPGG